MGWLQKSSRIFTKPSGSIALTLNVSKMCYITGFLESHLKSVFLGNKLFALCIGVGHFANLEATRHHRKDKVTLIEHIFQ